MCKCIGMALIYIYILYITYNICVCVCKGIGCTGATVAGRAYGLGESWGRVGVWHGW